MKRSAIYTRRNATDVDGGSCFARITVNFTDCRCFEQRENVVRAGGNTWHKWKLSTAKRVSPVHVYMRGNWIVLLLRPFVFRLRAGVSRSFLSNQRPVYARSPPSYPFNSGQIDFRFYRLSASHSRHGNNNANRNSRNARPRYARARERAYIFLSVIFLFSRSHSRTERGCL